MTGEVTKADLKDLRDTIIDEVRSGFSGVHERQDKTNGRVTDAHIKLAEQGVKIRNLEAVLFGGRHRRKDDDDDVPPTKRITERDVKIVFATLCGTGATVSFFWKVLPAILKALLAS